MSTAIPTQMEKCKGAMLGTAIGDALGWPNEPRAKNRAKKPKIVDHFVEWTRSTNNPRWHDERILPGEYSDDTQLTLSVARSIITGDWEKFFAERELPFWLKYERGGGGALLRAAKSISKDKVLLWQSDNTKAYFNAGGNGATMRILPHVIAAAKKPDATVLMQDIIKDVLITHGHPRAFLGATCYAYALDYLLRKDTVLEYGKLVSAVIDGEKEWGANLNADIFGKWLDVAAKRCEYDFPAVWENTRNNMLRQLEFIKVSLKKGLMLDETTMLTELGCFGKANGAGDVAALAAIYFASAYANNPVLGVKTPAFSLGADTDTIASIAGGLVGMLSGTNWIPAEWKGVQDYECLIQMTELLLADDKKGATKTEVAEAKAQDKDWQATPIGKMRVIDSKSVPNGNNGIVIIHKWQTALGQTLYTKAFQPNDNQLKREQSVAQDQAFQQPALHDSVAIQEEVGVRTQVVAAQKAKSQFVLDIDAITALLCDHRFKSNITVGKVLKIIRAIIESKDNRETVAKQFGVDCAMVDLLESYTKLSPR